MQLDPFMINPHKWEMNKCTQERVSKDFDFWTELFNNSIILAQNPDSGIVDVDLIYSSESSLLHQYEKDPPPPSPVLAAAPFFIG